jgi:hypothetical protein
MGAPCIYDSSNLRVKLLIIKLVGISFLSVKKEMGDPYKIYVAVSKNGNQILHHSTFLRLRPIKSKTNFVLNISGMTDLIWQTFAHVLVKFGVSCPNGVACTLQSLQRLSFLHN